MPNPAPFPGQVLNLWRILHGELKLNSYSFEERAAALLRRRHPAIPRRTLGAWFAQPRSRWRVASDVARRARAVRDMASALDLIVRTAELAKASIEFGDY